MSASPSRLSLLLPAYLSDTLNEADRRYVEDQLAASADARAELEELRSLKAGLLEHWDSEPAPSPSARARVMAAIGAPSTRQEAKPGLGDRIGSALSALFAPKWMPAAALALIVLQFGLLVSMRGAGPLVATPRPAGFQTELTVVLQPGAKQSDLTALLKEMRAEIIAGPDASGTYTLGLRTDNPDRVNERLTLARSRTDVVSSIDIKKP